VTVQRQVQPATTQEIVTPAVYETIQKKTETSPERAEWRQVLCEANASVRVVSAIQRALKTQGFYSGPIDGQLGTQTYAAVKQFQTRRNLSTGGLTLRTVEALGVDWRSMVSGGVGATGTTTGGSGFYNGPIGGSSTSVSGGGVTGGTITGGSAGSQVVSVNGISYVVNTSTGVVSSTSGAVIGRMMSNGDIVATNGSVLARGVSLGGGSGLSGTIGSGGSAMSTGGATGGVSVGGFTVRADGSVANSSGVVIGRLDPATGNIIDGSGNIIGRMNRAQ